MKFSRGLAVAGLLAALPGLALAADIDGSALSVLWGVPFAGILLSIALMPLLAPIFWHHHFGKVAAGWALAFLVPFALVFGPGAAGASFVHALVAEYIPFVILLTALFTVAGASTSGATCMAARRSIPQSSLLARCSPASWAPRERRCCSSAR